MQTFTEAGTTASADPRSIGIMMPTPRGLCQSKAVQTCASGAPLTRCRSSLLMPNPGVVSVTLMRCRQCGRRKQHSQAVPSGVEPRVIDGIPAS